MQSLFEKNGGTYRQEGGYLIPNLEVPKQNGTIGKYGRLHKKFIKQSYPAYYSALFMSGKLFDHLHEVDLKAQNELDRLIPILAKQCYRRVHTHQQWHQYGCPKSHKEELYAYDGFLYGIQIFIFHNDLI